MEALSVAAQPVLSAPIKRTWLNRAPAEGAGAMALLALALVFATSFASWLDLFGLREYLSASGDSVFGRHEWWRLFTTLGVHGDPEHLLSNSFFFFGLSFMLSGYFGAVAFPVLAVLGGALANAIALATYDRHVTLVGASGVVYFMAAFWLAMSVALDRRVSLGRRLLQATGLGLALLTPSAFDVMTNEVTSHRTHAIGFALGTLAAVAYFVMHRDRLRAAEVRVAPTPDPLLEEIALEASRDLLDGSY